MGSCAIGIPRRGVMYLVAGRSTLATITRIGVAAVDAVILGDLMPKRTLAENPRAKSHRSCRRRDSRSSQSEHAALLSGRFPKTRRSPFYVRERANPVAVTGRSGV